MIKTIFTALSLTKIINMSLGDRIRTVRKVKGYSQAFMALQMKISQYAYCKLELGKTDLTVLKLLEIAVILQTPAGSFFEEGT